MRSTNLLLSCLLAASAGGGLLANPIPNDSSAKKVKPDSDLDWVGWPDDKLKLKRGYKVETGWVNSERDSKEEEDTTSTSGFINVDSQNDWAKRDSKKNSETEWSHSQNTG